MTEPLFATRDLCFRDFLSYPDLTVSSGQVTFITGRSGSGKSTLLKLFNATENPSHGTVLYRGTPLSGLSGPQILELRRDVSLVSQDSFLFPGTIRDSFQRFFTLRKKRPPKDETIRLFLDLCNVSLTPDGDTSTLSGGERQRVYIALFLSLSPRVLLLDEPTAALDTEGARTVLDNLTGYCQRQETDLVVVSHDPALRKAFSGHTVDLDIPPEGGHGHGQ